MSRTYLAILVALAAFSAGAGYWALRPAPRAAPTTVSSSSRPASAGPSRAVTIEIGGMVCAACAEKIQHQLAAVEGVQRVEVDLARRRADVLCEGSVADTTLTAAVRRAGPEYLGLILGH
jgi:copper chaperone CopZ